MTAGSDALEIGVAALQTALIRNRANTSFGRLVVILRHTNFTRLFTPECLPRRYVYDAELADGELFERL